MTEQLHDLMVGIADRAGAGPSDPTLWARARKARRDRRRLRVAAVAAAVAAVLGTLTFAGVEEHRRDTPPPVEQPHRSEGPGIPSTVFGVPGDGGLQLERDLAVGRASVALATSSGAFVVTAADGVYHRLRLPGYYPRRFSADLTGLALSPDGRQLVWSWHSPQRPGQAERPDSWGVRLADLTTGGVRSTVRVDGSGLYSNPRWSPDSRYIVMDQVFGIGLDGEDWVPPEGANYAVEYWGVVLDTRSLRWTKMFGSYTKGSPYDPWVVSPPGRAYRVIDDQLVTWEADRHGRTGRRSTVADGVSGLSTGRVSPDGRWMLVTGRSASSALALVDVQQQGAPVPVAAPRGRTVLDVLGWTDDQRVLALLAPAGPEEPADLVRLALDPAPAGLAPGATGPVQLDAEQLGSVVGVDAGTSISIAVDLAARERTTWEADPPPFVDPSGVLRDSAVATEPAEASEPVRDDGDASGSRTWLLLGLASTAAVAVLVLGAQRVRRLRAGSPD